jgi:hypothetical protein
MAVFVKMRMMKIAKEQRDSYFEMLFVSKSECKKATLSQIEIGWLYQQKLDYLFSDLPAAHR